MRNLLQETLEVLAFHNKTPSDVLWVGSWVGVWFTWKDFETLGNVNYDNGYGGEEVARDLIVMGEDFWLERGEYDGKEWWDFKTKMNKPGLYYVPKAICTRQLSDAEDASISGMNGIPQYDNLKFVEWANEQKQKQI